MGLKHYPQNSKNESSHKVQYMMQDKRKFAQYLQNKNLAVQNLLYMIPVLTCKVSLDLINDSLSLVFPFNSSSSSINKI